MSEHVFNILNICATLFKMLHHCMTCNVSQYLQKNAAYIKPLKKIIPNNLKIMDSDTLFLTHVNAERKERKQEQPSAHGTSRRYILFVKYILVRKYILNYKPKRKANTDRRKKEKKWHSHLNRESQAENASDVWPRRTWMWWNISSWHEIGLLLVIAQKNLTKTPENNQGKKSRMNFTETAHVFENRRRRPPANGKIKDDAITA